MRCTVIGNWGGCCKMNEACSGYLLSHEGFHLLLDCGSGVLSVLQNVLNINELNHILLTHYHFDHFSDAGSAIYGRLVNTQIGLTKEVLNFYALKDETNFATLTWDPYSIAHEINASSDIQIGPFHCTFLKTKHPKDCLAVKVECNGKTLVYTADTGYFDELVTFSEQADLLISECSLYKEKSGEMAGHLNSTDVAKLANKASVKKLLLSHLPIYGEVEHLKEQVMQRFTGEVILAQRLLSIELKEERSV